MNYEEITASSILRALKVRIIQGPMILHLLETRQRDARYRNALQVYNKKIAEIRYCDLSDNNYWMWLFGIAAFYTLVEGLGCYFGPSQLKPAAVIFTIPFIISSITSFCVLACKSHHDSTTNKIIKFLARINASAITVSCVAGGLMWGNCAVVYLTGGVHSPFLGCLFSAALLIVGLPRENTRATTTISIIVTLVVIILVLISPPVELENGKNISVQANITLFVLSCLYTWIMRHVSTNRI